MWHPLEEVPTSVAQSKVDVAVAPGRPASRTFINDLYTVTVRGEEPGDVTWLSIRRNDRQAVHDWRHMQQIKNEVCGMEREGVELYPAESRLADGANEYHLWVLPEGMKVEGLGFPVGLVTDDDQARRFTENEGHIGQQREWEEGLTTGRNEHTKFLDGEQEKTLDALGAGLAHTGPKPLTDAEAKRQVEDLF